MKVLKPMPDLIRDYRAAAKIITRAINIIALNWTNKGYFIRNKDGTFKCCLFGAVNLATQELYDQTSKDCHLATIIIQDTALRAFGQSGVSVNDDMGLPYVIRLLAISLEEAQKHALRTPTYFR